jgi:hypothetical protein
VLKMGDILGEYIRGETMVQYDIYDTNGKLRAVTAPISSDRMRVLLSVFKTHCVQQGKEYEFNHFANWLRKYHDINMEYVEEDAIRIDM